MPTLDLLVFFTYMLGVAVLGGSFYRRNKSSEAFTTGSGRIPAWVLSLSVFATFVSSISYLALPGSAYQSNWNAYVFSLSLPLAAVVGVTVFVPLYRKVGSPSAYAYLEARFGAWARVYASTMYLLTQLMRVGTILYLMALAVNAIFGWDIALIITVTGLVVLLYSAAGGLQAVAWTDAIQALVLIIGALVTMGYILFSMPEGAGQMFEIAAKNQKFSLGSFGFDLSQPTFWVVLVYGTFINLQNFGIDQNYVQRYMAAGSASEAKQTAFWGGMLYVPVSLLFLFIGTALFAFYHSGAGELPEALLGEGNGDRIFPHFIVQELPTGLTGLLIASIFAAGMSTVSTSFNSAATVVLVDYFERFSKTAASDKTKMRVLYGASLAISVLGIGIGIAMMNVKSALDAWWQLASVFSGGMLGLFLLGAFSRAAYNRAAAIGVACGVLVIFALTLAPLLGFDSPFHPYLTIVFGTTTIFLVGFLVMWLGKGKR